MKNAVFPLLLLHVLLAISLSSQFTSSCVPPPVLRDFYRREVANLALRQMYDSGSPDTALVRIPNAWTEPIMGYLAAVFSATTIQERDSVFDLYCVHDLAGYRQVYSNLIVQVDTSYAWTEALQNNTTLTGDSLMDLLMTKYDLDLDTLYL